MNGKSLTIGFIINPIAGIGGAAGLKGSDDLHIVEQAMTDGFDANAPRQAKRFIDKLAQFIDLSTTISLLTCAGEMGENVLKHSGIDYQVVYTPHMPSTRQDTFAAYQHICQYPVDVVVFVGGDGTARDILDACNNTRRLHLGIAGGVKIQSSVFALSPAVAAQTVIAMARGKCVGVEREVLDINEADLRQNIISAKHYGNLYIASYNDNLQGAKSRRPVAEQQQIKQLANYVYQTLPDNCYLIIGPGSTTMALKAQLGGGTLLGVDVYYNKQPVKQDVNRNFLDEISSKNWHLYLTCTGGQGFLLGRGNQQIGPSILQRLTRDNLSILAGMDKIIALQGNPLRIDCGDDTLEKQLSGFYPITVGNKQQITYYITN